jgi:hypothetical protein
MLTSKEASRLGRRGGNARARNLSAEKRREIASWAWFVREQKRRGKVTETEQRRRLIELVQAEDPDLAALLKFLSRLPATRAEGVYRALPDKERELVERKAHEVLGHGGENNA